MERRAGERFATELGNGETHAETSITAAESPFADGSHERDDAGRGGVPRTNQIPATKALLPWHDRGGAAAIRFRLRANPCVTRNSKRLGLLQAEEQEAWIERKGRESCGFSLPRSAPFGPNAEQVGHWDVSISQARRLRGMQRSGNSVTVYSVLYDGILTVSDPVKFKHALENGVGHGKALGLGLLSVAPLS